MKYLKLLLLIILLPSCTFFTGFKPRLPNQNHVLFDTFPESDKAIVIFSINSGGSNLWHRVDDKFNGIVGKNSVWFDKGSNQIAMIEPGIYSLGLFYTKQEHNFSSYVQAPRKTKIWKDEKPYFASFEVKSGEVLYIGDIDMSADETYRTFTTTHARVGVKVEDQSEKAKELIKTSYPKLYSRFGVRLIKVGGAKNE